MIPTTPADEQGDLRLREQGARCVRARNPGFGDERGEPGGRSKLIHRLKLAGALLAALFVLVLAGFYVWTRIARYPAAPAAAALAEQSKTKQGWYVFGPEADARTGFIFYPGGLVDPAAYAPLMKQLSDRGVLSVIVPMPLDLAVFGANRAGGVIEAYPQVDAWIIGGHSLGGAMAAEYVKDGQSGIVGLVFLASYSAGGTDLSAYPLAVTSIYGTEDGVAGDVFEESLRRLPPNTRTVVIEGGNHAQFGDYGPQKGDGTATVSRAEQQRQTVDAILDLTDSIEPQ